MIGQIPKSAKGLYQVEHGTAHRTANAAEQQLTIMELHRCMGHISVDVVKHLVVNVFVTGLQLVPSEDGDKTFCQSCVTAKLKHRPVPKECEGEHVSEYAGEVHSDLWGPAPIQSL
ncbi:hypothetical protein BDN67DRAFT_913596, partial [Paxillus ammoniavirescens]